MLDEIKRFRKELHQYPELSGSEFQTAIRIKSFITKHHPTKIIDQLGGTGLAAIYEFGVPDAGPAVAIRCELDALPIEEENHFKHRSENKGVAHKCGHDGHMAIVSALIFWLKEQSFLSGKVVLLFQPAEETGQGANNVLEDERFKDLGINYLFALHNIPGEPSHRIITMDRGFSAEVQSFSISLKGKESHAAEPENGINPATAIAEIIAALSKLEWNKPLSEDFAILTPVHISMGQKSYGISPADAELHYTIRTWSSEKMTDLKSKIEAIFKALCQANKLAFQTNWFEHFPASKNDNICNKYVAEAARKNGFEVQQRPFPFKFGEDFGWFSKAYKTAMFGLGAGIATPPLHNAAYDFPDEIIETGADMFKEIITGILRDN